MKRPRGLYSITLGIYFAWFYKPIEKIYSNSDTVDLSRINKSIESINNNFIVMVLCVSFALCFLITIAVVLALEEIEFYNSPVIEVNAKLVSQESDTKISGGSRLGTTFVNTRYKLIFEIDNGEEMSFSVSPKKYYTILEGNKGILKYKEGRIDRFISFYIKKIE